MSNSRFRDSAVLDVVGIGNAIVDVLVQTDETFLHAHGLHKGGMALIDETQAEALYQASGPGLETSGGSVANTMVGIAQLGGRTGFIGRVRDDQLGGIFSHDIRAVGARFETPAATTGATTARCLIYVTPDAERTMCTFLGASTQLEPEDLDLSMVSQAKVLYLEGYLWDSPAAKRAFIAGAEACRAAGGKVALSLSDGFCVERHRESFLDLVNGHVDVLFANEAEIASASNPSKVPGTPLPRRCPRSSFHQHFHFSAFLFCAGCRKQTRQHTHRGLRRQTGSGDGIDQDAPADHVEPRRAAAPRRGRAVSLRGKCQLRHAARGSVAAGSFRGASAGAVCAAAGAAAARDGHRCLPRRRFWHFCAPRRRARLCARSTAKRRGGLLVRAF